MARTANVYLSIGSNMGDREAHLANALAAIARLPGTHVLQTSRIYTTAPWGRTDQPDYLNMAAQISTSLEADSLLACLKEIEKSEGRVPGERWGPRTLDIDILLYGSSQISTGSLQVPHPRMWERAFVLRPLAEIAPGLAEPSGTLIEQRLADKDIMDQQIWLHDPGETRKERA